MEKQLVTVEILKNQLKTEQRIFMLMRSFINGNISIDKYESLMMR